MNDCELLELAAKAAGYHLKNEIHNADDELIGFRTKARPLAGPWNPLADDGDVMRLAVDLSLHVRVMRRCIMVEMRELHDDVMEPHGADRRAAARRAIVRAAAIIGKAMP